MPQTLALPLAFGLVAALVTTLGLATVMRSGAWGARNSRLFGVAAGGMLVTMVLLHIAPEALARTEGGERWVLAGFLGGLLMTLALRALAPGGAAEGPIEAAAPLAAIGVHSLLDGMIYAVTFSADTQSGIQAATALILHEFPEGVIAFTVARRFGLAPRAAFVAAFAAAALTTPLGVLAAWPLLEGQPPEALSFLFALTAGLLLFVATIPLLGSVAAEPPRRGLAAVSAGVALGLLLAALPLAHSHGAGHGHGHDHHDGHGHSRAGAHAAAAPARAALGGFQPGLQAGTHDPHAHEDEDEVEDAGTQR